jgi:hypothetical protein
MAPPDVVLHRERGAARHSRHAVRGQGRHLGEHDSRGFPRPGGVRFAARNPVTRRSRHGDPCRLAPARSRLPKPESRKDPRGVAALLRASHLGRGLPDRPVEGIPVGPDPDRGREPGRPPPPRPRVLRAGRATGARPQHSLSGGTVRREHNAEVFAEIGLTDRALARLREAGAVA